MVVTIVKLGGSIVTIRKTKKGERWTSIDDVTLKRMYEGGASTALIGTQLHRSRKAVSDRYRRLKAKEKTAPLHFDA